MASVTIPLSEYIELKQKAQIGDGLLVNLIKGLEDVRKGKVKLWKRTT